MIALMCEIFWRLWITWLTLLIAYGLLDIVERPMPIPIFILVVIIWSVMSIVKPVSEALDSLDTDERKIYK